MYVARKHIIGMTGVHYAPGDSVPEAVKWIPRLLKVEIELGRVEEIPEDETPPGELTRDGIAPSASREGAKAPLGPPETFECLICGFELKTAKALARHTEKLHGAKRRK